MPSRIRGLLALSVVVALLGPTAKVARADAGAAPPADAAAAMEAYFLGERAEGYAWFGVGDASLVGGGALLAQGNRVLRGMSYPLLAVGAIQFVAGLSSLSRSESRIAANRRAIAADPARWLAGERTRLERLEFLFKVIRITELSLLGVGVAGVALGGALHEDEVLGAGIGLAVEAALMLTLDHFAERRARRYLGRLRGLGIAVDPQPGGSSVRLVMSAVF